MRFPIDTPEFMKDWPFFNQTGNNSMAALFIFGLFLLGFGVMGVIYYSKTDRYQSQVESGRVAVAGFLLVILSVVCWHLLNWTANDYS